MSLVMIATHYDNSGNMVGIRIIDTETGDKKDVPYKSVVSVLEKQPKAIENIELKDGKIVGYNGTLDRYARITDGKLVGKSSLVVLDQLGDVGYKVSDWNGTVKNYRNEDVIRYSTQNGIANGKVVSRDGKQYVSAIVGNYNVIPIDAPEEKNVNNNVNTENAQAIADATKEVAKTVVQMPVPAPIDLPELPRLSRPRVITGKEATGDRRKEIDEKTGMTVEQKMLQALLVMRSSKSFYYAMLVAMERVESNEVPTMGVTLDKLYYNVDFVKELTMPELVYVLHHEVCHVAMRHRVREGDRNHDVWNVACDAYINKHIAVEFCMKNDNQVYKCYDMSNPFIKATMEARGITNPSKNDLRYDTSDVGMQSPKGGVFIDDIDVDKDTPEMLYEEMMKNMKQSGGGGGKSKQGQGGSSGGSGSSGGQGGEEEDDDQQGAGGADGQDTGDDGDDGDGDDSGKGKEKQGKGRNRSGDKGAYGETELRGKKIVIDPSNSDMVDTPKEASASKEQLDAAARVTMSRATVTHKQAGGEAGSFIERMVAAALAPVVNWRALLRRKLLADGQKINTYAKPDKRFVSRNIILPGPKVAEPNKLKGVKVCIDTSGSISDQDLAIALKQIQTLLKTYSAEAEMIYWDTQIRRRAEFKNVEELMKIKPAGGGGTDANCVFEYFDSKQCTIKPTISLIFTDGCFGPVDEKYHSKYRDTIWIIQKGCTFEAQFGTVAPFKGEDF